MQSANPRRWAALGLIALAQFMVIMDTSIGVALPEIRTDLGFGAGGWRSRISLIRQRSRGGPPHRALRGLRARSRAQLHGQLDRAWAAPAGDDVADVRRERRSRVISDDRAADQALDSRGPGTVHQPLEQRSTSAAPLPRIGDDDRKLSQARVTRVPYVPRYPDAVAALRIEGDERFVVRVVDVGEVLELVRREVVEIAEEPPVAAYGRELLEARLQLRRVARLDRPDADLPAIGEPDAAGRHRMSCADLVAPVRRRAAKWPAQASPGALDVALECPQLALEHGDLSLVVATDRVRAVRAACRGGRRAYRGISTVSSRAPMTRPYAAGSPP